MVAGGGGRAKPLAHRFGLRGVPVDENQRRQEVRPLLQRGKVEHFGDRAAADERDGQIGHGLESVRVVGKARGGSRAAEGYP